MPSPFPGMDPYLVDPAFWQDFHRSFITHCRDYLLDRLPDTCEARVDERVRVVEMPSDQERQYLPGVAVLHDPTRARPAASVGPGGPGGPGGGIATLEPVTIPEAITAEVRDTWIEVFHRPERSLVTVIEVLSPTNKVGAGFGEYMARRRALREHHAHLVELDLLVGGQRVPLRQPLPGGAYFAFVGRDNRHPYVDVYHWSVRDRLPVVPVPLRAPDPDAPLDLAAVFATTYERGRYARSLRYGAPPPAPLSPDDAAWAGNLAKTGA
jgi:hypothetical protein